MKRAVFSPKAYAFVNTQKQGVIDLSEHIIRGKVNRRIGAVSTADLELQNPNMIFTKEGGIRITPMDPITIFLERKKGLPVKTFTGFIDKSPYYQLLPGPVQITASCTLKKLLHTYFDPGLMYTQNFLMKYGWIINTDGTLFSPVAMDDPSGEMTNIGGESGSGNLGFGGSGIQGAASVAKGISDSGIPYSYGGGHSQIGTPSIGNNGRKGFDCSAYVAAILAGAGWGYKKGQPVGSSMEFANWGKPGKGKYLTVYYNPGHAFIHFEKPLPGGFKRADTSNRDDPGGSSGPRLRKQHRSTSGFSARHWEGF